MEIDTRPDPFENFPMSKRIFEAEDPQSSEYQMPTIHVDFLGEAKRVGASNEAPQGTMLMDKLLRHEGGTGEAMPPKPSNRAASGPV